MMVKSFSQDGYSSMKKSPSGLFRGRGMSAAASNEALTEAVRPSGSLLNVNLESGALKILDCRLFHLNLSKVDNVTTLANQIVLQRMKLINFKKM